MHICPSPHSRFHLSHQFCCQMMMAPVPLLAMLPVVILGGMMMVTTAVAAASSRPHPLDPLSAGEITAVRAAVLASPLVPARPLHFHYVGLDEPDKPDVLAYAYGTAGSSSRRPLLPRRALVIARAGDQSHELRVDVTDASCPSVLSHALHAARGSRRSRSRSSSRRWRWRRPARRSPAPCGAAG
jgi:primary-amine oxidase